MNVLILNPLIPNYRLPIFNELSKYVNLTIAHSGKVITDKNLNFQQYHIITRKIGPFFFYPKNLHRLCRQYDVIISEGNIRYIDRNFLILNPFRKYKWITWGIGVSASYKKEFDKDNKFDFIRHQIFKKADAQVFYSDYPIKKYITAGFPSASLFVANNTVQVHFNETKHFNKSKILFVGTLYKEKKIYDLLNSYSEYNKTSKNNIILEIIGNGVEYDNIQKWISANNLEEKVILLGEIFDQQILEKHFREAYACISPGQAGLSVLTAMGYGTPFITKKNAITGGEIFNIQNNYNGILYENEKDLTYILTDIEKNREKYLKMGENARNYYKQYRMPEQMVNGLYNACLFVLSQRKKQ